MAPSRLGASWDAARAVTCAASIIILNLERAIAAVSNFIRKGPARHICAKHFADKVLLERTMYMNQCPCKTDILE